MLLYPNAQAVRSVAHVSESPLSPIRVLVVDDDHNSVMMVRLMIERIGMHVDAANCGPAAIQCLRKYSYDAVVTDLQMPSMDGCELVGWIKQKSKDTIAIIMTGCSSLDVAENQNDSNVDAWLFKPFGFFELNNTLQRLRRSGARIR
jgi:CheY-like chemotaxis protein